MKVRLKRSEVAIAEQAAALRWQLARASGVENKRIDQTRTDNDVDLLGIKAEIAVAKIFDIPFSASELGVDSGNDLFINAGARELSLQVKATFYEKGRLLFAGNKPFTWDAAILVCSTDEPNVMRIDGWISRKDAHSAVLIKDLGQGNGRCIEPESLSSIEELWAFIQRMRYS
jgi:hypothetical protein